jgi:hypothetical protein
MAVEAGVQEIPEYRTKRALSTFIALPSDKNKSQADGLDVPADYLKVRRQQPRVSQPIGTVHANRCDWKRDRA